MKKNLWRPAALLALALCAALVLAGCNGKPTDKDARAYVQALLDVLRKGDYDHSVKFANADEDEMAGLRDKYIDEMAEDAFGGIALDDETKQSFREAISAAFECAKYTVGDAEKVGDGAYDVTVNIEPFKLYEGIDQAIEDWNAELFQDPSVFEMSDEDFYIAMLGFVPEYIKEQTEHPSYADPVDVVVRYEKLGEVYGVSEEEYQALGEQLLSPEGID